METNVVLWSFNRDVGVWSPCLWTFEAFVTNLLPKLYDFKTQDEISKIRNKLFIMLAILKQRNQKKHQNWSRLFFNSSVKFDSRENAIESQGRRNFLLRQFDSFEWMTWKIRSDLEDVLRKDVLRNKELSGLQHIMKAMRQGDER